MDVFDELLRGVRGRSVVLGHSVLWPPWSVRFTDGTYLTLCVPLRGGGWIVPEDAPPRELRLGEAAIVRGPAPFVFADAPGPYAAAPARDVRCGPGGADVPSGEAAGEGAPEDVPGGATVLMAGAYDVRAEVPQRLLRVLPRVLVVPDDHDCAPMRDYLEAQLAGGRPGRQIVVDRLLDWMLVCTLRDWFERPEAGPPPWYRALGDEVVGAALRALHEDPARAWTTASLAAVAGVSRTTLAKRFTELVGQGPAAYLAEWRMTLAADLLARDGMTVAAVARRVGYADAFGFGEAFKRVRGVSPGAYRREAGEGLPEERAVPVG